MHRSRWILLAGLGLLGLPPAGAQTPTGPFFSKGDSLAHTPPPIVVRVGPRGDPPNRAAPPAGRGALPKAAAFHLRYLNAGEINYYGDVCVGWPAEAKAAFTYAATIWATLLRSPVPIAISACWADMGTGGILGHGGARSFYRNFSGAPASGIWFPVATANALAGFDLNETTEEIVIAYNASFDDWYFGTDGRCPADKIDFVQVILHEMCHGLGFLGSMAVEDGMGDWGFWSGPTVYDLYAETGSGVKLTRYAHPSAALAGALTSGDVYFSGPNAAAANGGARPKLYCPSVWRPGSSYAHLDEIYNGTPNAMMTYSVSYGESLHHPGALTLGLLADVGWTLGAAPLSVRLSVNGSHGPIGLNRGAPLDLRISLAGAAQSDVFDFWLAVDSPWGLFCYDVQSGQWQPATLDSAVPSYQGATGSFTDFPVFTLPDMSGLSAGGYLFYFGIDTAVNGRLDMDRLYTDTVTAYVGD